MQIDAISMKPFARSAALFVAIGMVLYGGVHFAAERQLYRTGDSNPFFKIATADAQPYDWVILGASHAMPLDFADFNQVMERETGMRILNLAATGGGPLYNRFVLEQFLEAHQARNLLYVVDSFAFFSPDWNEGRFADTKLLSRTPFLPSLVRRFAAYAQRGDVDALALLDYLSGFSKINNHDRFEPDIWEAEAKFERVYKGSKSASEKRITYLFPNATPDRRVLERYLRIFDMLMSTAKDRGMRVVVVKPPLPTTFYAQLPYEPVFDDALLSALERQDVGFHDFSHDVEFNGHFLDTDHLNRDGARIFFETHLRPVLTAP